mgnify:CR=1 FL=1|jgi:hypothetical protein
MFNSSKKAPHDDQQQLKDAQNILATLQPVLDKVYSNKAMLFLSKGFDGIEEFLYYLLALSSFVFIFIMNTIFPFHLLGEIVNRPIFREQITSTNDINSFHYAVKALVLLIGILFIILGLKKRVIRNNKTILHSAATELKKVSQYFSDKVETLSKLAATSTNVSNDNPENPAI